MNNQGKILLFLCLVLIKIPALMAALPRIPEEPEAAQKWLDSRIEEIHQADAKPFEEKIETLGEMLRQLEGLPYYRDSPEKLQIVTDLRARLLSTPGHAQYFANKIERLHESVEGTRRGNQTSFDFWRDLYLRETLSNLPSPETVKVLGHYLDDMRHEAPPGFELGENAYLAMVALSRIGLRDSPVQPLKTYRKIMDDGVDLREEPLTRLRTWYKQVESGELAFSFIGQDVEYRFNPDGTWETIPIANPPDDAPRAPGALAPEQQVQQPAPENPDDGQDGGGSTLWFWLGGFAVVFSAGIAWFIRRPQVS